MLLIYHNDIWAKSNYQDSRAKMTSATFELRPKWFLKTHSLCQLKSKTIPRTFLDRAVDQTMIRHACLDEVILVPPTKLYTRRQYNPYYVRHSRYAYNAFSDLQYFYTKHVKGRQTEALILKILCSIQYIHNYDVYVLYFEN